MFYYDVDLSATTSGTANTETQAGRLLTVANQRSAVIMGLYLAPQMAAAGGVVLQLKTAGTAGSAGSSQTPAKRHSGAPAAGTTAFTAHTAGSTLVTRQVVGASAAGGFGGWVAGTIEEGVNLAPNGGANGNAEVSQISALISTIHKSNLAFLEV